ncbi:hypothetical protein [Pseudofrankia sp. BMG5.37]|uniref:hypothetical protein n=1 Tax=Pseudofrankia sp. BMG5.37 TaxID=3050035 RepID=UPI002895A90E|nr:hypothetical protein [Pseudofrankia sp. BMG5.37]MDT3446951.1 hypothetical protein [Pseudofrankia sp. BMG5.37]
MIIVLSEMAYPAESDDRMRSIVPAVEQFCQTFHGCERFALSFPADQPGVLVATEIWQTPQLLREHVGVAHDAVPAENAIRPAQGGRGRAGRS